MTTSWSVISGLGAVDFDDPGAVDTGASLSALGDYVLRLTASDGALPAYADTGVTVLPDAYREAMVARLTETLPGVFEQNPEAQFSDLWECRWDAPAADDPDSVAQDDARDRRSPAERGYDIGSCTFNVSGTGYWRRCLPGHKGFPSARRGDRRREAPP